MKAKQEGGKRSNGFTYLHTLYGNAAWSLPQTGEGGGSKARTKRRGKGGGRHFLRTPARHGHGTKRPYDSARDAATEPTQEQQCLGRAFTKDHGKGHVFLLMRPILKICVMSSLAKETPIACSSRGASLRFSPALASFFPFENGYQCG